MLYWSMGRRPFAVVIEQNEVRVASNAQSARMHAWANAFDDWAGTSPAACLRIHTRIVSVPAKGCLRAFAR